MTSAPAELSEIDWHAELFTTCAIPGCVLPVATPGDVCTPCQRAFGHILRTQSGIAADPGQTAAELAARDAGVLAQYRDRTATAPVPDPTPKRNQSCWLCEQRRTCTFEEMGWDASTAETSRPERSLAPNAPDIDRKGCYDSNPLHPS